MSGSASPVLLAIDSSPMTETAVTRRLTRDFVGLWRGRFPAGEVIYRDLGANPPPHPDALTLGAFGKPPDALSDLEHEALRLSDRLVEEFIRADHVVIGSPMYNFTVTSGLKAWIDLVGRPGRTFSYGPAGAVGLLRDKQIVVVTARGGFYAGTGPEADNDFQEGYLRAYFRFMGLEDVHFVHAEGQGVDLETARRNEAVALEGLRALFDGGVVAGP
jgi:FMN-dependent NADH-azoreductase